MQVTWGYSARDLAEQGAGGGRHGDHGDGHALIVGVTGAGKTYTLKRMIREMAATGDPGQPARFRSSTFTATLILRARARSCSRADRVRPQTCASILTCIWKVRKRVKGFMATMSNVMRELGPKQRATLRNVLYDVYERHGFRQDDPSTWVVRRTKRICCQMDRMGASIWTCPLRKRRSEVPGRALGCCGALLV